MRLRSAVWLVVGCGCLGCDPSYDVRGTIVETGSGAPVDGATIRVTCPNRIVLDGKSEATGAFHVWASTGIVPKGDCTLAVDKPRFATTKVDVDACSSQWTSCVRELGKIELSAEAE